MSSYNSLSGTCECYSGYVADGSSCTSGLSYCWDKYGFNSSYSYLNKNCECSSGYELKYGTCTRIPKETVSDYPLYYSTSTPVPKKTCPSNSHESLTDYDKCTCDTGYTVNASKTSCVIITETESCQNSFGFNSYGKNSLCYCKDGYQWNSSKTSCSLILITPTPVIKSIATPLSVIQQNKPSPVSNIQLTCKDGYAKSLNKNRCIKIPLNAHIANDGKNVWLCDDGYLEKGNSCVLTSPSLSPFPTTDTSPQNKKSGWGKFKFW